MIPPGRCRSPRSPACATTPATIRLASGCAPSCSTCRRSARGRNRASRTGRLIGVGFGSFTEQTGHGAAEFASRGASVIPGFESCTARILTDGSLVLMVGIQSHGQGLETALSQIAYQELGINPARISVRHGDTESTAFGFGTFASRSMVMSGGAVARASRMLRDKLLRIGAHLLQCEVGEVHCADGSVIGPQGRSVTIAEIGKVAHLRMDGLPPGVEPLLDATATYEPAVSTGVYSYATHGAVVAVDPETGADRAPRFRGRRGLRHDGQPDARRRPDPRRRRAGHRHRAVRADPLRRARPAARRDPARLPPARRLRDADIRIAHLHTPAVATEYGIKGMGEGGAVAPPAAIANAVRDALAAIGAEVNETPLTSQRVLAAIRKASAAPAKLPAGPRPKVNAEQGSGSQAPWSSGNFALSSPAPVSRACSWPRR